MKKLSILFFTFLTAFGYSQPNNQNKVVIDTVEFSFKLKDIADITSFVPQIKSGVNHVAQKRINDDLKTYFQASSIKQDSVAYVKELLKEFGIESLEEYFEQQEDYKMENPYYKVSNPYYFGDELEESFSIEYLSDNILNIGIYNQILPYGGRYMFSFWSLIYDLRTGNQLNFEDFLTIDQETLLLIFRKNGYKIDGVNAFDEPNQIPIDQYDEFVDYNLKKIFNDDNGCVEFYFNIRDNDIHLMLKFLCAGPYLMDYGIPLNKLNPHVIHSEFKEL